jgi:hypothetical protein
MLKSRTNKKKIEPAPSRKGGGGMSLCLSFNRGRCWQKQHWGFRKSFIRGCNFKRFAASQEAVRYETNCSDTSYNSEGGKFHGVTPFGLLRFSLFVSDVICDYSCSQQTSCHICNVMPGWGGFLDRATIDIDFASF